MWLRHTGKKAAAPTSAGVRDDAAWDGVPLVPAPTVVIRAERVSDRADAGRSLILQA